MNNKGVEVFENGWMEVPFSYMAQNISKRVDPKNTDLEIYIGLEHLDSRSLKIKNYGKPEDVKGTKLIAQPGDIIFGKRRAYQGKVGVCEWDAIVSAHSMVLRSREENIEKDFLKFFMQSQEFYNRSIQISEGSLSPTIKWKVLEEQRFIIPPRDTQKKIVNLLSELDNLRYSNETLIERINLYRDKLIEKLTVNSIGINSNDNEIPDGWSIKRLGDVGETYGGLTGKNKNDFGIGKGEFIPYTNVYSNEKVDIRKLELVNIREDEKQNTVIYGDILFTASSETVEEVGLSCVMLDNKPNIYLNSFCFGYRFYNLELYAPKFYKYFFRSKTFRREIVRIGQGSTRFNLSKSQFLKLKIIIPPKEEQVRVIKILEGVDALLEKFKENIEKHMELKEYLLNNAFNLSFYNTLI